VTIATATEINDTGNIRSSADVKLTVSDEKLALQRRQCLFHDRKYRSQRMITPHPRLKINVAK